MSDRFAALAWEFIALHFPSPNIVYFESEAACNRMIYAFLAERHPNIELTAKTVNHLAWSIGMLAPKPPAV